MIIQRDNNQNPVGIDVDGVQKLIQELRELYENPYLFSTPAAKILVDLGSALHNLKSQMLVEIFKKHNQERQNGFN